MKKFCSLLLAVVCILSVLCVGCSENVQKEVAFSEISSAIAAKIPAADQYKSRDDNYPFGFFETKADDFANLVIMQQSSGELIDEYGVFEAKSAEEFDKAEKFVSDYLTFYRDVLWDDRYKQDQFPKLRDAEYRTYGNKYVVYAILDDAGRADVFDAVNALFAD